MFGKIIFLCTQTKKQKHSLCVHLSFKKKQPEKLSGYDLSNEKLRVKILLDEGKKYTQSSHDYALYPIYLKNEKLTYFNSENLTKCNAKNRSKNQGKLLKTSKTKQNVACGAPGLLREALCPS